MDVDQPSLRDKRPTMADVAARVGVSRALVSLVFRNHQGASAETRERIYQAAAELGYRPDTAAQLLRRRRSRQLGVLFDPRHPFQADLIEAIYPAAMGHEYSVILGALTPTRGVPTAVDELLALRSEAIILIGPDSPLSDLAALGRQLPLVTVGRHLPGDAFDSVRTDDAKGARQAVEHLGALGHREIVHIDGGSASGSAERRRGYRSAMRRLAAVPRIIPGDFTEESGARAARLMSDEPSLPTAVLASNDRCAVGLLDSFLRLGVRVPQDVSVVGYDDSQLARLAHIDLTTIRQDVPRMAEAVVEAVTERLDHGRTDARRIVLEPSLVVRSTSSPPRTHNGAIATARRGNGR